MIHPSDYSPSSIIYTKALSRVYRTYEKPQGLMASLKGIFARQYQEKTALHDTDLSIEQGQIVGLVGANGAGKTTLLKLLSGLIHPTGGQIRVLGSEPALRHPDFLRRMSILLGQKNQLWWDISPLDSFELLAKIYGVDTKEAKRRVQFLADMLDATHVLKTQLRRLSLGERMKMELIGALLHAPEVLFLDEPTIGLDVVAQKKIREFIATYAKEKRPTIILTSHYMDDIAQLSHRLLLMSRGKMVYDGDVQGFIQRSKQKHQLVIELQNPIPQTLQVFDSSIQSGTQMMTISLSSEQIPQAVAMIASVSTIKQLKIEEPNFEDVIHSFLSKETNTSAASLGFGVQ